MDLIRILCLSDTHLGFDSPLRPRINRRRRGPDFFENYRHALKPALEKEVDCVVHSGDILYRSKVPAGLVAEVFEPLKEIASSGIPVFVVPGNHERSQIPFGLFASHPNLFIFNRPRTFTLELRETKIALSGFPFYRGDVRSAFQSLLEATQWRQFKTSYRLLCIHQCFDGSTVGPSEFVFRNRPDVIRPARIPGEFTAVINGHIHRAQILIRDLSSQQPVPPIIHPGSTERTSFAEKDESKGYFILELVSDHHKTEISGIHFVELPTRPMVRLDLESIDPKPGSLSRKITEILRHQHPDSIVQLRISQTLPGNILREISNPNLRRLAPATMNVSVVLRETQPFRRKA